jgi:hypothetical protein
MLGDTTVRGLRAQIKSGCFKWEKMTEEEIEEVRALLADMHDLERDYKHHKEVMVRWNRIMTELENFLEEEQLRLIWNGYIIVNPLYKLDLKDVLGFEKIKKVGDK